MPTFRLQISLQDKSGLPRDQYVNTLHVAAPTTPPPEQWAVALAATEAFYQSVQTYLSPVLASGGHTFKVYLVGAPKGTPPIYESIFFFQGFPGNNAGALPNEVACCMTFHADPQPTLPRQSWRGRLYIGPLSTAAAGGAQDQLGRPKVDFRTALMNNGVTWFEALALDLGVGTVESDNAAVVVYSRVHGVVSRVNDISIDDSWDTQRSRGNRPTGVMTKELARANAGGPAGPV